MLTAAIIAVVIAVAVVAVLVYAATKPDKFGVQRAASIGAPPEKIFPLIDDLHAHTSWSPFEKDPNMKRTHSGAARGKGAVYEWEGNRQVGAGRLATIDSTPSKVTMALDMLKPFEAHNVVEFTLEPKGSSTNVTWAMRGRQPYMAKLMSTFINCDKMVGSQFEEGLGKLKALAER
jgi:Polyketide cyclase / dehydrase and lipid transport